MKSKLLYTLLISIFTNLTFSQENTFQKVTVHYKSGIVQSGTVDSELLEFEEIYLNQSENKNPIKLKPSEIEKLVDEEDNDIIKTYEYNNRTYFIKLLVGGKADLYFLENNLQKSIYIAQTEEHGRQTLIEFIGERHIDGKNYKSRTRQYLGIMSLLFQDCPNIKGVILDYKYSMGDLSKAFIDYNNCVNSLKYSSPLLLKKEEFRIALLAGANFDKVISKNENISSNYQNKTGLNTGIELSYLPVFAQSKFSTVLGVRYSEKGGEGDFRLSSEFPIAIVNYKIIDLNLSFRYNFLNIENKLNPFLGVSLNKAFIINKESAFTSRNTNGKESNAILKRNLIDLPEGTNIEVSYEIGITYKLTKNNGLLLLGSYYPDYANTKYFKIDGFTLNAGYYFKL